MSVFFTRRGKAGTRGPTFVDYLESTGTQHIDTLYHVTQNTVVECDFQFTEVSGNTFIFRVVTPDYGFGWNSSAGVFKSYGRNSPTLSSKFSATGRHTLKKYGTKCIFDDSEITTAQHSAVPNYTLPIFAYNNEGTIASRCKARLYSFRIYESDVLVRDFRPCYDPDGIACLYDEVEKKYYYNQGSGEFIAGAAA